MAGIVGGWFSNPIVGKLWNQGSSVLKQGGTMLTTVGTSLKQNLDNAGVTQTVTTFMVGAAEKTVEASTKLYQSGSEKFTELQHSNPKVGEITEMSKQTLGTIGGTLTDMSSVSHTITFLL